MSLWFSLLSFNFDNPKDCPSLNILKSRLTSRVDHDNVPKYYYYGPRLTQILHAFLCVRSSSLNEHLYICAYKSPASLQFDPLYLYTQVPILKGPPTKDHPLYQAILSP
jgi:hypothetical protein